MGGLLGNSTFLIDSTGFLGGASTALEIPGKEKKQYDGREYRQDNSNDDTCRARANMGRSDYVKNDSRRGIGGNKPWCRGDGGVFRTNFASAPGFT